MAKYKQQHPQHKALLGTPFPEPKVSAESIVELDPDAVVVADAAGHIILINRQTEVLFGYPREELLGQPVEVLLPERFHAVHQQHRRSYAAAPVTRHMGADLQVYGRRRDGSEFQVEVNLGLLPSEDDGGESLVISTIRDVSELPGERELALRRSEEWFRSMADTAPVLLWVAGTDGLVTFVNVPWLRFTGRRVEQEVGNGWADGVHPNDYHRCLETYLTAFRARESFTMVYRLRRFDGEYRWLVDSGVPRFAQDGSFEGYIGSAIDITEREQLKQEREEAQAREWAANEVAHQMDEFFALAAHDIRSPVTAVAGNVQLAQRRADHVWEALQSKESEEGNIAAPVVASLTAARTSVDRLIRLTNLLFDMAQARLGKLEVQLAPCDLAAVVHEQVAAGRVAAPGRTIHLEVPDQAVIVLGDTDRLGQVLTNYITNALKYSPDDQPIKVLLQLAGGIAVVSVRDEGPGLPQDEQVRVWELFHRVPGVQLRSSSGGAGSLGLGLHISKCLVELHHGQVGVESEEGQGATFWFRLPLMADAETNADASS